MDPSAPRDPNAPPDTSEGDAARPPESAPPPQQSWQSQPAAPPPPGQVPQPQENRQSQPAESPPQQSWQSQPAGAPPQPGGGPGQGGGQPEWVGTLTSQQVVPGPAGYFYADVPNRSIAMVLDIIGILVIYFIVGMITLAMFGFSGGIFQVPTTASLLAQQVISAAIWAAYFIYTWVAMRGTIGMKLLGLQVGHESDGRTLTYEQAAWRFGVLFGPQIVIGLLGALVPALGVLGLLSFVWLIYVLITIAQSPTKQGIHDKYAHSMVVKAGRAAG
jgi:uncharacterized RDD family membrane protein YckC